MYHDSIQRKLRRRRRLYARVRRAYTLSLLALVLLVLLACLAGAVR